MVETESFPTVARRSTTTVASQNIALTVGTRAISVRALTANCRIALGGGPQTANNTSSIFLAIDERQTFTVPQGDPNLAVIRDTAAADDGVLEITELRS